MRKEQFEDTEG